MPRCLPQGRATIFINGIRKHNNLRSNGFNSLSSIGTTLYYTTGNDKLFVFDWIGPGMYVSSFETTITGATNPKRVIVKPGLWTGLDWTDDHSLNEVGPTFFASMDLANSYQTDIE